MVIVIGTTQCDDQLVVFQRILLREMDQLPVHIDGFDFAVFQDQTGVGGKRDAQFMIAGRPGRQGIIFGL
ncbi:hypothetical protein D3C76_1543400 [compost metagenome]